MSSRSASRSTLSSAGSEYHHHTVRDETFEVDPAADWETGSRHDSAASVASQQSDASSRPFDPMLYRTYSKTRDFNKKLAKLSEPRLHASPPVAPPRVAVAPPLPPRRM